MYNTSPQGPKPNKPNKKDPKEAAFKVIASNRSAFHDYEISDTFEAGIALTGTEVKSLRLGQADLKDGFAFFEKGEVFLYNVHIGHYREGNVFNHEPTRARKLLLHKNQILRIFGLLTQKGLTVVPIKMYFKTGLVKVEIGVAKAKKLHDRRREMKAKIADKEVRRAIRDRKK